ncbi:hypothetical protein [Cohnella sp. WQ 127256]|uniref:hemoblobin-interacting domain-containing protein n=1 Tax=Cohnella sp. WQ 127256 TaxID=2938790 RepID=UPI0021179409|nr:hypothetical protein [Cohnella sp. WQ 127256]
MRKIQQKATVIFLAMLMVLGGLTGLLTPGGSTAYAADTRWISDENIIDGTISADHKTVTLTTNVLMNPLSDVSVTDAVYVKRTDPGAFVSMTADSAANTVTVTPTSPDGNDQTVFVLTFDVPLTGDVNQIQIQGQYFVLQPGVYYEGNATTEPLDLKAPAYVGSNSGDGSWVDLYFDEYLYYNTTENIETFLRSKLSISTDGVTFEALPEHMYIEFYGNWIYLENDYGMKVILGKNTRIKIASGTFKDNAGNLNDEMNLDITPPVIQSAVISEDNKQVTITFNESVFENTDAIEGELKDYIKLLKNDVETTLIAGDTVSIEDGKLIIRFAQALTGGNNQIAINGYVLKDKDGNISQNNTVTSTLQTGGVGDSTAPKLINYYFSSDLMNLTYVFDEDVVSNTDSIASQTHIRNYYWNDVRSSLLNDVVISGNTMTLQFNSPLNETRYYIYFESNILKDTAGNILYDVPSLDLYPQKTLNFNKANISHNGRWLNLEFNLDLLDNTIVAGSSHLKEKIKVSTDQGVTFLPLTEKDVVTIQGNRLVVLFDIPKKSGTLQVIVEKEAVSYSHIIGGMKNLEIKTVIAHNTPDLKGYFFSNAASEFIFEDDAVWRSKVRDVIVRRYDNNVERNLTDSEYTLTAGKLTINKGVFDKGIEFYVYIDADGYSRKEVRGYAFHSSELFYMTTPVISTQGGILAKVNLLRNEDIYIDSNYGSTQTVVFELMDGNTPVSIVASELDVYTGTYSAQFNVIDAATNDKYTVKAFVVNHFSNDFENVGLKMTTLVTQTEYDLMLNQNGGGGPQ